MSSRSPEKDLSGLYICHGCIEERFLSDEIKASQPARTCSYCDETEPAIALEGLAARIDTAFEQHYYRTSDQPDDWEYPLLSDSESAYEWERSGEPVQDAIESAAGIGPEPARDVVELLDRANSDFERAQMGEETEFSPASYYEMRGSSDAEWLSEWRAFEQSLKTEARFFNSAGASHLRDVFTKIDLLRTSDGRSLVVSIGPGTDLAELVRARVFQSGAKLEECLGRPDIFLGPPPAAAASGGRMNARGIAVFYGATNRATAIAEVRPPVGSQVVAAKFKVTRPLRVLDLTALENAVEEGSIFDPTLRRRQERVAFMRSLGRLMTRPVMPDDEALEYLSTQAVADFLATENDPPLDGILFPSVQAKEGQNVVLFHKAAKVEVMDLPPGTEVVVHKCFDFDDESGSDYEVTEEIPLEMRVVSKTKVQDWLSLPPLGHGGTSEDARPASLSVDLASIVVHDIAWAHYEFAAQPVRRRRLTKSAHAPDF